MGRSSPKRKDEGGNWPPFKRQLWRREILLQLSSVFLEDDLSRTDFGPASGCVSILVYKYRDVTKSLLEKIFVLAQIAL